jgi:hypothetical protein
MNPIGEANHFGEGPRKESTSKLLGSKPGWTAVENYQRLMNTHSTVPSARDSNCNKYNSGRENYSGRD